LALMKMVNAIVAELAEQKKKLKSICKKRGLL
jgi:hypothetical protein